MFGGPAAASSSAVARGQARIAAVAATMAKAAAGSGERFRFIMELLVETRFGTMAERASATGLPDGIRLGVAEAACKPAGSWRWPAANRKHLPPAMIAAAGVGCKDRGRFGRARRRPQSPDASFGRRRIAGAFRTPFTGNGR
jgi:hypothetical protein